MLSLAAPFWLLGLLGVPLVRWLHRFARQDQVHAVAALFLWRPAASPERQGRRRGPPDPRWRLRALLLAALALALARPVLQQAGPAGIEVWIDDSPSLQTLEGNRTRLQHALDLLDRELAARGASDVWLRSLGNPALRVAWHRAGLHDWQAHWRNPDLQAEPGAQPPPAVLMAADREHWLVTDGADAGLNAWAGQAPLRRILQTGTLRDNVALTRLALRPALRDDGTQVLVSLHNLGAHQVRRELVLYMDEREIHRTTLDLPPHAAHELSLPVPEPRFGMLRARLEPADALAWDDQLTVTQAALDPVRVDLDAACPHALRILLRNHPRLRLETGAVDALPVRCGQTSGGPGLHFLQPVQPRSLDQAPRYEPPWPWLEPGWLHTDPSPATGVGEEILLGTREQPLISLHAAAPRRVTVHFDIAQETLVRQPEYPVLVDALLTTVLQRALLDETFVASRPVMESHIAPLPLVTGDLAAAPASRDRMLLLDPYLLLLALLLLTLDLLRARRDAPRAG